MMLEGLINLIFFVILPAYVLYKLFKPSNRRYRSHGKPPKLNGLPWFDTEYNEWEKRQKKRDRNRFDI